MTADENKTEMTEPPAEKHLSIAGHLEEFRSRLIRCLVILILLFPVAWPFSPYFIHFVWNELCPAEMGPMYYTAPMEFFFLKLKISFIGALALGIPLILWQILEFINPALYRAEKRLAIPMCLTSFLLFVSGAGIALFLVFPLLMRFSIGMQTDGVRPWISVSSCLGLAHLLMLGFGLCFQLPIILLILIRLGAVSVARLRKWRPYIVVGIFILAGLLTPPDIVSQLIMGVPTWLLYELSLIIGTRFERKPENSAEKTAE